ncbi:hypothetical protein GTQ40_16155 [Flavobacteriaceae bacterium R38]|nr:hypothetical protein [Flavobacteriaceae bacterium R38]
MIKERRIKHGIFYSIFLMLVLGCNQNKTTDQEETLSIGSDIEILDANRDGIINPYEALDVLLLMQEENQKELKVASFSSILKEYKKEEAEEIKSFFEEFDQNGNGKIELSEADEEMLDIITMMDENKNKEVTISEMTKFDFASAFLASEEEIDENIANIFEEHDAIDTIELTKIPEEEQERFSAWDINRDKIITKQEIKDFETANNTPVRFEIKDTVALMNGVITNEFPATVLQLLFEHPEVTTIEMMIAPGSIDDVANLRASLYINKSGLTTKVNAYSHIASGGTDFFLAGKQRIVEEGAVIGVHSWGGGAVAATDLPKDDPSHEKYLDYYKIVNIPTDFYWYTLQAAPANGMHNMTKDEIEKYKIRTEK